jgi:hypothetical protein
MVSFITTMRRAIRRLVKSERGAVYAEAAISLPVFILIWGFLIFSHRVVHEKIRNNAIGKGCTWMYAVRHCKSGSMPAVCNGLSYSSRPTADNSDRGAVSDFLTHVPFIGDLALGEGAFSTRRATARKPNPIGGGELNLAANHSVSCRPEPKTVGQLFGDLWNSIWGRSEVSGA